MSDVGSSDLPGGTATITSPGADRQKPPSKGMDRKGLPPLSTPSDRPKRPSSSSGQGPVPQPGPTSIPGERPKRLSSAGSLNRVHPETPSTHPTSAAQVDVSPWEDARQPGKSSVGNNADAVTGHSGKSASAGQAGEPAGGSANGAAPGVPVDGALPSTTERCAPFGHKLTEEVGLANYIPFRNHDLVHQLEHDFPAIFASKETKEKFERLNKNLSQRNMLRMECQYGDVYDKYVYIDPDCGKATPGAGIHDIGCPEDEMAEFSELFHEVLDVGDFDEVPPEVLEESFNANNSQGGIEGSGLQVKPTDTDEIEYHVWYRGRFEKEVKYRSWRTFFRSVTQDITVFSRLVIMFRERPLDEIERRKSLKKKPFILFRPFIAFMAFLRQDHKFKTKLTPGKVYLKLFKDANDTDVDLLLPGVMVKFTWFDYAVIFIAMAVGLGAALWKIAKGTLQFDTIINIALALGLILMPLWVAFSGYLSMKKKRIELQMYMGSLYMIQCISSNAGVLACVLDETCEQEDNETILAYFFLWKGQSSPELRSKEEVDAEVEHYLIELMKKQYPDPDDIPELDFEVLDSLHKLQVMGILSADEASGKYKVMNLDQAIEQAQIKNFDESVEGQIKRTKKKPAAGGGPAWQECVAKYPSTGQHFRYFWNNQTNESSYSIPSQYAPLDPAASPNLVLINSKNGDGYLGPK